MDMLHALPDKIENEFKRCTVAFLRRLERITPPETLYALLFEISNQDPGAWPIAATEESLTRMAMRYVAKGYKARNGNDLEMLRVALRWDAPGDDMTGWYWGDDSTFADLNKVLQYIELPETLGGSDDYDDDDDPIFKLVKKKCLNALKELDEKGIFGSGADRERLVVGISNVDFDFENFLDELAVVNPTSVVERLRSEVAQGHSTWDEINSP